MSHTPGPWTVHQNYSNGCEKCPDVRTSDNRTVAIVAGAPHVVGPEPTMSNARLIAAAPDLLLACKAAAVCLADHPPLHEPTRALLAAAIARVEGRA